MVGQYGCVCELLVYVLMEGMPDYLDAQLKQVEVLLNSFAYLVQVETQRSKESAFDALVKEPQKLQPNVAAVECPQDLWVLPFVQKAYHGADEHHGDVHDQDAEGKLKPPHVIEMSVDQTMVQRLGGCPLRYLDFPGKYLQVGLMFQKVSVMKLYRK